MCVGKGDRSVPVTREPMTGEEILFILLKVLAVLVLVALNGFFVAAEFALVKVRDSQLTLLAAQGHRRAPTRCSIMLP